MNFSEFSRGLIRPIARLLARLGVHPNLLTVLSAALNSLGAFWIAAGRPLVAVVWFVLFAPLDALDGEVARLTGRTSRFGAFLDSTLDRVVDGLVFSAMAYALRVDTLLLSLSLSALLSAYLISYARARVEGLGGELREGLMSRYPRFLGLLVVLLVWGMWGREALTYVLTLYVLLLLLTVLQRLTLAYRRLRG